MNLKLYGGCAGGGKSFLSIENFIFEMSFINIRSVAMREYVIKQTKSGKMTKRPRGL